jgi:hypothetical protein
VQHTVRWIWIMYPRAAESPQDILTAEIANLLRPPKLQSGVLKKFWKGIFGTFPYN